MEKCSHLMLLNKEKQQGLVDTEGRFACVEVLAFSSFFSTRFSC